VFLDGEPIDEGATVEVLIAGTPVHGSLGGLTPSAFAPHVVLEISTGDGPCRVVVPLPPGSLLRRTVPERARLALARWEARTLGTSAPETDTAMSGSDARQNRTPGRPESPRDRARQNPTRARQNRTTTAPKPDTWVSAEGKN
jgi:hypothetical protein